MQIECYQKLSSVRGFSIYTMMCLIILVAPNPLFASDDMNGLSRQDTLPAEDPSWLYSQVRGPGQPAPIPSRSEPVLYIPRANDTVDHSDVHTIALCLKNLRTVKVHLPTPPANSESMNGDGEVVCIIDCSFRMLTLFGQSRLQVMIRRPSHCWQWPR